MGTKHISSGVSGALCLSLGHRPAQVFVANAAASLGIQSVGLAACLLIFCFVGLLSVHRCPAFLRPFWDVQ